MAKKTFNDELYGKIAYKGGYWLLRNGTILKVNNKEMLVETEISVYSMIYEEFRMGLLSEELMQFHRDNPQLLNADKAEKTKKDQKELYKEHLIDNINKTIHNIEESALRKREELIKGENEETFSKIVGKEKAKRVFAAKTREEKLDSLELIRLRVLVDTIEITCKCDWFEFAGGGFVIFPDGSVEMFDIDSMSI